MINTPNYPILHFTNIKYTYQAIKLLWAIFHFLHFLRKVSSTSPDIVASSYICDIVSSFFLP